MAGPQSEVSPEEVKSALDFSSLFLAYMSSRNNPSAPNHPRKEGSGGAETTSRRRGGRRGRKKAHLTPVVALPPPPPPVPLEPAKPKAIVDPRKYKTRLCSTWQATGACPYEHTCCFAHGMHEMRDLSSNHKLLASIGYFSNVILLSMSNGEKPALPPHALYEQPSMFQPPQTAEELAAFTQILPAGVRFPFQDILPEAMSEMSPLCPPAHYPAYP